MVTDRGGREAQCAGPGLASPAALTRTRSPLALFGRPRQDSIMDSTSSSFEQPAGDSPPLGQALVERDGVLIHHGKAETPVDVVAIMHEERESRALLMAEPGSTT